MKKFFLPLVTCLTISLYSLAQTRPNLLEQANWQQKVDYKINVSLDTNTKTLHAFEELIYQNNSPQSLQILYMHIWPNAYKNRNTAYARQELENGKTNFHFADEEKRGFIDSLDFKVNGQKVSWEYTNNIDIVKITLPQPLLPQQKLTLSTPFRVKLPAVFSRLGYEEGHYCITQWYPKPAVYDINGWNPMPYLNQGEFYSEYGNFEVSITAPKNLVLAATGEVQDPTEKTWWKNLKNNANAPHPAQGGYKTLVFKQENVHDFAWFAHHNYRVDYDTVMLGNGSTVETWIFALTKGKHPEGIEHLNDGVRYYSDKVGNYPYSIAQVVITPLEAGGGMEYPTITNCGSIDRTTIIHEVGHNWFYGILGSNEREYPWMDESINTYYEERSQIDLPSKEGSGLNVFGRKINPLDILVASTLRKNTDQPGNLRSELYTDGNYGAIVYGKNPRSFMYLQYYLGDQKFDAMMHAYFDKWKFKHPLSNDFRKHAEQFTGENLNWFFDDLMGSTQKIDYKLKGIKNGNLVIANKGQLNTSPLAITRIANDSNMQTKWVKGFKGTQNIALSSLNFKDNGEPNVIYRIDGESQMLELYRQNNTTIEKGKCSTCQKVKLQPILNLENQNSHQIFVAPVVGYNLYNKGMLGLSFYNSLMPQKKNEFAFTPMYSFETKDINGYFSYWHNFYTKGKIRNIKLGLRSSRFANNDVYFHSNDNQLQVIIDTLGSYSGATQYEKFAPFLKFEFKPTNPRSNVSQSLELRYVMVNIQTAAMKMYERFGTDHYGIANLSYNYKRKDALYPASFNLDYQYGVKNNPLNRLAVDFTQGFTYAKHDKVATIRLFAGVFLNQTQYTTGIRSVDQSVYEKANFQAGGTSGTNDYLFDEAMIGRNDPVSGFWGHQILNRDAGFRNFVNMGSSDKWLSGANVTLPFPLPVPIGIYGDVSYGAINQGLNVYENKTNYVGGFYLMIIKDICYIYIPAVQNSEITDAWNLNGQDNFFKRASFTLNLNKLNPISMIRDIKL